MSNMGKRDAEAPSMACEHQSTMYTPFWKPGGWGQGTEGKQLPRVGRGPGACVWTLEKGASVSCPRNCPACPACVAKDPTSCARAGGLWTG